MTNKEAIAFGNRVVELGFKDDTQAFCELAIKALEQDPCGDAISRQAALDLCERFDGCVPYSVLSSYDMLPSVTPQPKTGHWIDTDEGFSPCECSECKAVEFKKSKYCPNCGAKMDVDG